MSDENKNGKVLDFGLNDASQTESIIKVIGVGGGGGNAVNHMFRKGIHDVSFVVCNTDKQALSDSPVPAHLQLGKEGLGAGNKPDKAREAAEETIDAVREMLDDGTRMAFITAGMGGGTGTGAGPVIARESKNMGILTVGIVTIPFKFEGTKKINQALDGLEEMSKNVDALLVINNQRLLEICGDMSVKDGYAMADDTLTVAAKSIAEIITVHGEMNLDFNDVQTVLKDGGVAIMSTGFGSGEGRVKKAIEAALHSPLLNDNDVFKSRKVLLFISSNNDDSHGLMMDEMNEVNAFMERFNDGYELKWGMANDPSLGDKVKVTILATGFGLTDISEEMLKRNNAKLSVADNLKKADEEDKKIKEQERMEQFYGKNINKLYQKRRPRIFCLSVADLDNEDLILSLENSTTCGRTMQQYENISRLSTEYAKKGDDDTTQAASASHETKIINFV